jgi:hypothetical protein
VLDPASVLAVTAQFPGHYLVPLVPRSEFHKSRLKLLSYIIHKIDTNGGGVRFNKRIGLKVEPWVEGRNHPLVTADRIFQLFAKPSGTRSIIVLLAPWSRRRQAPSLIIVGSRRLLVSLTLIVWLDRRPPTDSIHRTGAQRRCISSGDKGRSVRIMSSLLV